MGFLISKEIMEKIKAELGEISPKIREAKIKGDF